eukprot:scaffold14519_cov135-Isochrysis_galbana.AAC.10
MRTVGGRERKERSVYSCTTLRAAQGESPHPSNSRSCSVSSSSAPGLHGHSEEDGRCAIIIRWRECHAWRHDETRTHRRTGLPLVRASNRPTCFHKTASVLAPCDADTAFELSWVIRREPLSGCSSLSSSTSTRSQRSCNEMRSHIRTAVTIAVGSASADSSQASSPAPAPRMRCGSCADVSISFTPLLRNSE